MVSGEYSIAVTRMKLLLLPGMDGTAALFADFVHCLPSSIWPMPVAYDANTPKSYDELFRDFEWPTEPCAILAESYSGPLGIRLAAAHPDKVRALILVNSFAQSPSLLADLANALPTLAQKIFERPPSVLAIELLLLNGDSSPHKVQTLRSVLAAVSPKVLAKRVADIAQVNVCDELKTLRLPVLYLAGKDDRLVGTAVHQKLGRCCPMMKFHHLDGPHLLLQARPADAARVVAEFLPS